MSLENQTIGLISSAFAGLKSTSRQHHIGTYRLDLCFIDCKLAIECDELGHADRDPTYEAKREKFILAQAYMLLRINPNSDQFNIARILNYIMRVVYNNEWSNTCIRL
jgi:very-short-patch-repair endonuclease